MGGFPGRRTSQLETNLNVGGKDETAFVGGAIVITIGGHDFFGNTLIKAVLLMTVRKLRRSLLAHSHS